MNNRYLKQNHNKDIIISKNNFASKKILCYNIVNKRKCNYGTKCLYAHSLSEQQIDQTRKQAFSLISSQKISNINLIQNKQLYETLLQLTHICSACIKNSCPGGYNCRNGAINNKYKVCYDDLVYGKCKHTHCLSNHLTPKGLICYNDQKNKNNIINTIMDANNDSSQIEKCIYEQLFAPFIKKHDDNSDSDTEDDIKKTIEYLNNDTDGSDDESIFMEK